MLIDGGRSSVAWATTKALVRRRDIVLGTHTLGVGKLDSISLIAGNEAMRIVVCDAQVKVLPAR